MMSIVHLKFKNKCVFSDDGNEVQTDLLPIIDECKITPGMKMKKL